MSPMARGWDSKAVEEQISEREAAAPMPALGPTKLSPLEAQNRVKRQSLMLARTRTRTALEGTRDEAYRQMLERALQHLDAELAELG